MKNLCCTHTCNPACRPSVVRHSLVGGTSPSRHHSRLNASLDTDRSSGKLVITSFEPRGGRPTRTTLHVVKAQASAEQAPAVDLPPGVPRLPDAAGPTLVWFKRDLRVADHPGLLAALAARRPLLPFFCLDPALYADLALQPNGPRVLVRALNQLRAELRRLGSDLVVRVGPAGLTAAAFAQLAGAGVVVAEEEVESSWQDTQRALAQRLLAAGGGGGGDPPPPRLVGWRALVWPREVFSANFRDWRRRRGSGAAPLPAPASLPALPSWVEVGEVPSEAALARLLEGSLVAAAAGDVEVGAAAEAAVAAAAAASGGAQEPGAAAVAAALDAALGGPETDLEVLSAYLCADSAPRMGPLGALRGALQVLESPAAPGYSFTALLGLQLGLGCLSRRQVWAEAMDYERRRWGGRLPLGGPVTPAVRAALSAAELSDFHWQLAQFDPRPAAAAGAGASSSSSSSSGGGAVEEWYEPVEPCSSAASSWEEVDSWEEAGGGGGQVAGGSGRSAAARRRSWRWQGVLVDYCVAAPQGEGAGPAAPALVLVHGFGAFGDQWRGNLLQLAAAGYEVYAPTLPGFGRSEKGALRYSQDAWRDYLRDFIVRVVRRRAVIAGNSIGGFISAAAAADYPSLVAGLVLLNSAGPISTTPFDPDAHAAAVAAKRPPPPWVAAAATTLLMAYLERSISSQLTWLYPSNPAAADAWLAREIYRAACDGRSPDVFRSVFYLPPPRPLDHLVGSAYGGPTLVLQGMRDPLNDAAGRAAALQQRCGNVRVVGLQAGHCPHDEVPEQVNAAILQFLAQDVPGCTEAGRALALAGGNP